MGVDSRDELELLLAVGTARFAYFCPLCLRNTDDCFLNSCCRLLANSGLFSGLFYAQYNKQYQRTLTSQAGHWLRTALNATSIISCTKGVGGTAAAPPNHVLKDHSEHHHRQHKVLVTDMLLVCQLQAYSHCHVTLI